VHPEPQASLPLAAAARLPARGTWGAWTVLACLAGVLLLYLHTTRSLYAIWLRSDTFAHGLIVFPVFAWMVWRERHQLAAVKLAPWPPALALVMLAGFGWLLGRLSASLVVEQFCMVALIPAAVWALLGSAGLRVLAFPFAFLFLAVPFGDFLVPRLIDLTADFTVLAVKLSGVPIHREGNSFEIPSGRWSVVEACSGIRYLMASILGAMLFSYFFFRSWRRRAALVLLGVAVALVGNWLRAYLIVMLGHLSDNELAAGVDHVVYGWLFFGVVIAVLFGIGLRWAEPLARARPRPLPALPKAAPAPGVLGWAALAIAAIAVWPAAHAFYRPSSAPLGAVASIPAGETWRSSGDAWPDWRPNYRAHALAHQRFTNGTQEVGVFVAYYRNQEQQDELVESRSTVIGPDKREWAIQRASRLRVATGDGPLRVNATQVRSASGEWQAWQWYWIGGWTTSDPYLAKAYLAFNRLLGRPDDSAAVVVYTAAGTAPAEAGATLRAFVDDMQPAIAGALARTRDQAVQE
jgi:exosortase A